MTPKEKLPAFTSPEECKAYCQEKGDDFFFTAFMLEAWIGLVICNAVGQYAENKSGRRLLQTGEAWNAWQLVFGHADLRERLHIFTCATRLANCDSPEGEMVNQMFNLAGTEDKYAGSVLTSSTLAEEGGLSMPQMVEKINFAFQRLSEWLEAIVHWHTHWMAAVAPIAFQGTEQRRALANIGLIQAGFAGLDEHGKKWWHFRHESLSASFHGKADWRLVGKAQSFEKWGMLRNSAVDELTIHWWPLLLRYHWTDRDMRGLLRHVVPHPDAYPLRDDREFADYRGKVLGLFKRKGPRDKSAADGEPVGWRAALAMADSLSE
jgi:hypothetical protein